MLQIILQYISSDEREEADGTQTVVPRHELMNIVSVTQLEKDTILVCHDNMVKVRVVQGGFFDCSALKMTKCQPLKEISELFLPKND